MNFQKGDYYSLNDLNGWVNFIDSSYITLVINEWTKCDELAKGSRSNVHQVQLLVYPNQWKDMVKSNRNRFEDGLLNNTHET